MSQFTDPTEGNKGRVSRPVNSVRNLQRWLNRQARTAKFDGPRAVSATQAERAA